MAITRRNDPFRGLGTVHQDLDNIFSNIMDQTAAPFSDSLPTMDVYTEDDKRLVVEMHLPGFSPEHIEVHVQNNFIEIRGERTQQMEEDNRERSYLVRQSIAQFFRRIDLPTNADADHIDATFENGTLRIIAPLNGRPESRQITVNNRGGRTRKLGSKRSAKPSNKGQQ